MKQINRVAVLGSGVMGATIAAHLANAGLEVLMLDMVPSSLTEAEEAAGLSLDDGAVRNRLAAAGLAGLATMKPAPFFIPGYAERIEIGNFSDDLNKLSDCDWVIEVVVEKMAVKHELLTTIAPHLNADCYLTTNTSGLSVNEMAQVLAPDLRKRFLVTHFFNPPRYMRLMEIIPGRDTDPAVVDFLAEFIDRRLGKGIVFAKDTANFIANRIGTYAIFRAIQHMMEMGLSVEEADAVLGPPTGRPKSAAFRTADLVGLDTLAHVATNSYDTLVDDEERQVFALPDFMRTMLAEGSLGNKAGRGFYKKETVDGARRISYYDYQTGQYLPLRKKSFGSVASVKQIDDPGRRIQTLLATPDQGSEFGWRCLRDTLLYAFKRIPEIADDVVNIDRAMRWGFNWELGPFAMFDAIGVAAFVERAERDGITVPAALKEIESFYRVGDDGTPLFYECRTGEYKNIDTMPGRIKLTILKDSGKVVERNSGAAVIDLGEGVFCLSFHSKMNAIGADTLSMTHKAIARAEHEGIGLVVGNQAPNFSVGANLMLLAVAIAEGAYEDVAMVVRGFQKATMALKYAKAPVVAAPFNRVLGGACEYCLHADAIVAHAETYMGMVEVGVGLLPAGGGTKEMCVRAVELATRYDTDVQPFIFKHFRQIAMAQVSMGAAQLVDLNYMRSGDTITMNSDRLIFDAKEMVKALAVNYRPRRPLTAIAAPGRSIAASIKSQLWNMQAGNQITEYEAYMGGAIAEVICGGDVNPGTPVSEQYLLALEVEHFLKLCGNPKTAQRIQHMLKTGKPLRN
jgi:3-hydroxyacyl-CoA dehydrogenase